MARAFADLVYANEPGTLLYVLTKHPTREHTYVWVERYRNAVAAERHRTRATWRRCLRSCGSTWTGRRSCYAWSRWCRAKPCRAGVCLMALER